MRCVNLLTIFVLIAFNFDISSSWCAIPWRCHMERKVDGMQRELNEVKKIANNNKNGQTGLVSGVASVRNQLNEQNQKITNLQTSLNDNVNKLNTTLQQQLQILERSYNTIRQHDTEINLLKKEIETLSSKISEIENSMVEENDKNDQETTTAKTP